MDNTQPPSPKASPYRLGLVVLLVLVAIGLFLLYESNRKKADQINSDVHPVVTNPSETAQKTQGSFSLVTATGSNKVSVSQEVIVNVVASSDNKLIVGYDVVLAFDPEYIDIREATSHLADFTVFTSKKSGQLIVTGAKKLESDSRSVFADSSIVRLAIIPKKRGSASIELVPQVDSQKSQMVDDQTNILLPVTGGLTLEIQ